ncbi:hypothetical protein BS47DRAFT_981034 [Hydnum rufescens UP504]|uniref:Uncharacterized protein n=1 Tax=Hydnum rufescens UP504 TaxID=1448309 RepID=A0A9P6AWJ0_9AGAM|nr:hypothetical protein BS47DRAFT_981034 [Hydnum rufescens UP504]
MFLIYSQDFFRLRVLSVFGLVTCPYSNPPTNTASSGGDGCADSSSALIALEDVMKWHCSLLVHPGPSGRQPSSTCTCLRFKDFRSFPRLTFDVLMPPFPFLGTAVTWPTIPRLTGGSISATYESPSCGTRLGAHQTALPTNRLSTMPSSKSIASKVYPCLILAPTIQETNDTGDNNRNTRY